ncbi:hypothetical protein FRC03_004171, partial [Tulasnella sp. 419]
MLVPLQNSKRIATLHQIEAKVLQRLNGVDTDSSLEKELLCLKLKRGLRVTPATRYGKLTGICPPSFYNITH